MESDAWEFLLLKQHDVFTVAQAKSHGLTYDFVRAQVAARRWRRLSSGIVIGHNGPLDDEAELWAAVLGCGRDARISHESAAHLQGLIAGAPDKVHITVPHDRRISEPAGIELHRTRNPLRTASGHQPPRTSVEDTVLDLADDARRADTAIGLIATALTKRKTTAVRLLAALAGRRRARWRSLVHDLLLDGGGIESPLEFRYVRDVERAHGLPTAERQDVVAVGGRRQRRDALYRAQRVVVELDGRLGHEGAGAFRDMRRDNLAAFRDELTLRYGWVDVAGDPCRVAAQVADVLRRRGWLGTFRRCPNCAAA